MTQYKQLYRPEHPKASASGCVYEHVVIAEAALGRYLPNEAEVHHVDGGRSNRRGNLVICQDKAYHKLLHLRQRVVSAGGDPDTQRVCSTCRELRSLDEFWRMKSNVGTGLQKRCKHCARKRDKGRDRNAKKECAA